MLNVFVPFNHQPDATSVKTVSYPIPTGYYARVTFMANGGACTVDGDTVLDNDGSAAVLLNLFSTTYTVPAGFVFEGSVYVDGSASNAYLDVVQNTLAPASTRTHVVLGAGTVINATGATTIYLRGWIKPIDPRVATVSLWLMEGQVINGTGSWRAYVEEYANG
jgi:N-acetylmuramic acid 6-phosphate (MurNAc-6-P) etherase